MRPNNLRIIYNNIADMTATTLSASSTAGPMMTTANLKLDPKSLVWRSNYSSTNSVKANLIAEFATPYKIGGVILGFTNLSGQATIRVRGYTGAPPTHSGNVDSPVLTPNGTEVFDTGHVLAIGDYNPVELALDPSAYINKKNYARNWIPPTIQAAATSISIEIIDPDNKDKLVEVSRLILGSYWSPKYNTSFGLGADLVDMSKHERAESGDVVTAIGATYNAMRFDLQYMDKGDRTTFNSLIKTVGQRKPIFISLFPDNVDDLGKEHLYQMYGKMSNLFGIEHPIFEIYSSKIEMEEV